MDTWTPKVSGPAPKRGARSSSLPWIPWKWVIYSYSSATGEEITALFRAYFRLRETFDIDEIISGTPVRKENDPCYRCGQCCARLLPEPVPDETASLWKETGNPACLFHAPIVEGPLAKRFYMGWFYEGVRLRMCPLLLRDPSTGDQFCVVYHLF